MSDTQQNNRKTIVIALTIIIICIVATIAFVLYIPLSNYNKAMKLYDTGDYHSAYEIFTNIADYKNSNEMAMDSLYQEANELYNLKDYSGAYDCFAKVNGYKDSNKKMIKLMDYFWIESKPYISAGSAHTLGLKNDGTVVAVGHNEYGQCNVMGWCDVVAVSAGWFHSVALKSDGTVIATGHNQYGECDVSDWKNIIAIDAGSDVTVGLKSDGTVVASGDNREGQCNVSNWKNIVAVATGYNVTVGLKSDGTIVVTGESTYDYIAESEQNCGIVCISADSNIIAINKDGESVFRPIDNSNNNNNLVSVSAGLNYETALKSDGTVLANGAADTNGQCDVSEWKDIIAISAGGHHTVGLKSDGTVVATEVIDTTSLNHDFGQSEVQNWSDIKTN